MRYCEEYFEDVRLAAGAVPDITALFNKRILITGATGMICSAVVDIVALLNKERNAGIRLLLAGRDKDSISERFREVLSDSDFEYLYYDMTGKRASDTSISDASISDYENSDIDYIIHGAGNADPKRLLENPVETMIGNIVGLQTLLEIARKNKNCRLLFMSSGEIYGSRESFVERLTDRPYSEEEQGYVDILNPRSCYPMSKRAGETLCVSYNSEYGVDTVIARSCHVYGPGAREDDSRASSIFLRNAASGKDIVMKTGGEQRRSYCYSLDCASALLTIMLKGEPARAYNIADSKSTVTVREVADAFAKEADVKVIFDVPTDAEKKSYNMMSSSVLSAEKLERLGWKATFSFEQGIKNTLKYF